MANFEPYTPEFENPYPASWRRISGFRFETHLYLARANDRLLASSDPDREAQYLVYGDYVCSYEVDGQRTRLTVPSGMLTDLASVPRIARGIVGRVGPHLEAAIVHDFLFLAWQDLPGHEPQRSDFRFANEVMAQAMIAAKAGFFRRNAILAAVSSIFAWRLFKDPNPGTRYVRVPAKSP